MVGIERRYDGATERHRVFTLKEKDTSPGTRIKGQETGKLRMSRKFRMELLVVESSRKVLKDLIQSEDNPHEYRGTDEEKVVSNWNSSLLFEILIDKFLLDYVT